MGAVEQSIIHKMYTGINRVRGTIDTYIRISNMDPITTTYLIVGGY